MTQDMAESLIGAAEWIAKHPMKKTKNNMKQELVTIDLIPLKKRVNELIEKIKDANTEPITFTVYSIEKWEIEAYILTNLIKQYEK